MKIIKRLNKGSTLFTILLVILLTMVLFTFFAIIVFKNSVNLTLHNLKNDLYLIGKNSLFSLERYVMGEDIEEIDEDYLKHYVKEEIKFVWDVDYKLDNGSGVIKSVDILELEALNEDEKDPVSGKKVDCLTVHLVLGVKVKPIIFNQLIEDKSYFKLHEDFKVKKLETGEES